MVSKEDKKIFASIQHSRATILKLMDVKQGRRRGWMDEFFDQVTKEPIKIKSELAVFEKAVAKTSDTLALGHNVKFTKAIELLRQEIFASDTDAFNKKYYEEALLQVLAIVQEVLAIALHAYEVNQNLQDTINTRYLAKSAQILEEARLTEWMEDEDYE